MANDQVSGKAAIDLAFLAYDNGRKSALAEPERMRFHVGERTPVDLIVAGAITPAVARRVARFLIAWADIVEPDWNTPEAPPEDGSQTPLTSDGEGFFEGEMPTEPNSSAQGTKPC